MLLLLDGHWLHLSSLSIYSPFNNKNRFRINVPHETPSISETDVNKMQPASPPIVQKSNGMSVHAG